MFDTCAPRLRSPVPDFPVCKRVNVLRVAPFVRGARRDLMSGIRYELTTHAATVTAERSIDADWIRRVLTRPERTEPDPSDPLLTHALGRIEERDQRVLRVVYNASVDPLRVVTAYFDRRQRGRT